MSESGWMIERRMVPPTWWTGDHLAHETQREWSEDSNECVRFARKADAEMVIVGALGLKIPSSNVIATEHEWESPPDPCPSCGRGPKYCGERQCRAMGWSMWRKT